MERHEESRTPPRDDAVRRLLVDVVAEDRQRSRKAVRSRRSAWCTLVVLLVVGLGVGAGIAHARGHLGSSDADSSRSGHEVQATRSSSGTVA